MSAGAYEAQGHKFCVKETGVGVGVSIAMLCVIWWLQLPMRLSVSYGSQEGSCEREHPHTGDHPLLAQIFTFSTLHPHFLPQVHQLKLAQAEGSPSAVGPEGQVLIPQFFPAFTHFHASHTVLTLSTAGTRS